MPTPPPNERMASPAAMHSRASRIDMSMPMRRARNVTSGLTAAKASQRNRRQHALHALGPMQGQYLFGREHRTDRRDGGTQIQRYEEDQSQPTIRWKDRSYASTLRFDLVHNASIPVFASMVPADRRYTCQSPSSPSVSKQSLMSFNALRARRRHRYRRDVSPPRPSKRATKANAAVKLESICEFNATLKKTTLRPIRALRAATSPITTTVTPRSSNTSTSRAKKGGRRPTPMMTITSSCRSNQPDSSAYGLAWIRQNINVSA